MMPLSQRFETIKDLAQNGRFCWHFRNELNQEQLFELAKILVEKNAKELAKNIKAFAALSQEQRYEIAKSITHECSFYTARNIEDFDLSQEQRFELAKIGCATNVNFIIADLNRFDLTPDQLFELAKISAKKADFDFLKFLKRFNLNEAHTQEVVKIALFTLGRFTDSHNYEFTIKEEAEKVVRIPKLPQKLESLIKPTIPNKYPLLYDQVNHHLNAFTLICRLHCNQAFLEDFLTQQPELLNILFNESYTLVFWSVLESILQLTDSSYNTLPPKQLMTLLPILTMNLPNKSEFIDKCLTLELNDMNFRNNLIGCLDQIKFDDKLTPENRFTLLTWLFQEDIAYRSKQIQCIYLVEKEPLQEQLKDGKINFEIILSKTICQELHIMEKAFDKAYHVLYFIMDDIIFHIDYKLVNNELRTAAIDSINSFLRVCVQHPNLNSLLDFLKQHPKLLSTLFEERDPSVYLPVLMSIYKVSSTQNLPKLSPEKIIAVLPLITMKVENQEKLSSLLLHTDVRDRQLRTPLIRAISEIKDDHAISTTQREQILIWLFTNKIRRQLIYRANLIKAIYDLHGSLNKLLPPITDTKLEEIVIEQFTKQIPGIDKEKITAASIVQTFLSMRNPIAIFTYASRLLTLSNNYSRVFATLNLFVNALLDNKFHNLRQDIKNNPHLQLLHSKHPEILKQYHQGFEYTNNTSTQGQKPKHEIIHQILINAHNDKHIQDEQLRKAMKLTREEVTKQDLDECIELFKNESPQFLQDLESMRMLFTSQKENKVYKLADTDNPEDILLCGSEVQGSCQRLEGDPEYNQGLIGYLLNGQTRLITLKETKYIKARAIIRLLIDDEENPVLFLERIYPQALKPDMKQLIINTAIKKAEMLKIPLVTKENNGIKPYPILVKNIGSLAPEYVDAIGGIQSTFQIKDLKQI